jgi:Na+/H+-dicarboxylate symporter
MTFLKLFLRFTWELPQTVLGFFVFIYVKLTDKHSVSRMFSSTVIYTNTSSFGVSLGFFIFGVRKEVYQKAGYQDSDAQIEKTKNHEYGHSLQSRLLGPVYLLVVGLPSFLFNALTRLNFLKVETYYTRFPENWADKLGKVKR